MQTIGQLPLGSTLQEELAFTRSWLKRTTKTTHECSSGLQAPKESISLRSVMKITISLARVVVVVTAPVVVVVIVTEAVIGGGIVGVVAVVESLFMVGLSRNRLCHDRNAMAGNRRSRVESRASCSGMGPVSEN